MSFVSRPADSRAVMIGMSREGRDAEKIAQVCDDSKSFSSIRRMDWGHTRDTIYDTLSQAVAETRTQDSLLIYINGDVQKHFDGASLTCVDGQLYDSDITRILTQAPQSSKIATLIDTPAATALADMPFTWHKDTWKLADPETLEMWMSGPNAYALCGCSDYEDRKESALLGGLFTTALTHVFETHGFDLPITELHEHTAAMMYILGNDEAVPVLKSAQHHWWV